MGLIPAGRRHRESTAIASSAFSKGHLLMYDSNSSLSRTPEPLVNGTLIAGVALADSLESVAGLVPYTIAYPGERYFADAATGSQYTPGERLDIILSSGDHIVTTSANTAVAIIDVIGSVDIVGSDVSRVLIQLDPDRLLYGTGG